MYLTEPRVIPPRVGVPAVIVVDPSPNGARPIHDKETGKIMGMVQTLNGVEHGDFERWHPNGRKAVKGGYRFGYCHGDWFFYDSMGVAVRFERWCDGRRLPAPVWVGWREAE